MTVINPKAARVQRFSRLQRLACSIFLLSACAHAPSAGTASAPERLDRNADTVGRLTLATYGNGTDSRDLLGTGTNDLPVQPFSALANCDMRC